MIGVRGIRVKLLLMVFGLTLFPDMVHRVCPLHGL